MDMPAQDKLLVGVWGNLTLEFKWGMFLHWLNLWCPSPVAAMTHISIMAHPTTSCSQSLIHAWLPLTHTPSSPLNCSFSWGVHACNYIKNSADHCLNPWSVILCCYRSFDLCPSLSSSQTLQGKHACLMRYYLLIAAPPAFSQVLDLVLDPQWVTRPKGTTHCYIRKENHTWLASLIPHLYTPSLGMYITLTQSLALTCGIHSLHLVLATAHPHSH